MMTELSLSCDEIHLLSRPLSQHTHLKQGSHSEISRDPVAPLLRTVTAGENALWEIHDSGEKDVMGQQWKKAFEETAFMYTGWVSKQFWKYLFLPTSTDKKTCDNILA